MLLMVLAATRLCKPLAGGQTDKQTEERMLRILTDFMSQGKLELLNL